MKDVTTNRNFSLSTVEVLNQPVCILGTAMALAPNEGTEGCTPILLSSVIVSLASDGTE